ncbi:YcnI family protein [Rhodococcus sp. NPDC056743]|uniref:YcnI family copper-binding membrane protein n=1 Tax=Rhodococcus sp. NPDC056743 TaxID=3345934 RepID=UPI00366D5CC5
MKNTLISRALITATATGGAILLAGGIASAHVSVVAPGATQGGYSVLTFRVPTESDTASTTKVTVALPDLKSARTEPMPGWTAVVEKDPTSLVAKSVTWTADPGVGVGPGQFQQFVLSAGPLPTQDEVSFNAVQTYSDGNVVNWDQAALADGSEPDKPAPSLTLAAATGDAHGSSDDTHAANETSATESSNDNTARWLGGAGLVLGALGAALGLGALVRSKRS